MKLAIVAAIPIAFASVALVTASSAAAASMTYGSVGILPGSNVDARYEVAQETCMREAATPPRGTQFTGSMYYRAAFKSCLYRKGFYGDGAYVYPVPLFGRPSGVY
jgi:hypothetical protein